MTAVIHLPEARWEPHRSSNHHHGILLVRLRVPRAPPGDLLIEGFGAVLPLVLWFEVAAQAPSPAAQPAPEAPRLKLSGEVAFRAEYIANELFAESDAFRSDDSRFRERVRLRVGGDFQATKTLTLSFRLSTGDPAFPPSAVVSFGNEMRRLPIQIDRAFVGVKPGGGLELRFGIQPNPIFTPAEMTWDNDVQPAGTSQTWQIGHRGFALSAGQFVLREIRSLRPSNEEGSLLFAEGLTYARTGERGKVTAGVSHYYYNNPDSVALALQTGELAADLKTNRYDPLGRTSPSPSDSGKRVPIDFFSGFSILESGFRLEQPKRKLSLVGEVAWNLEARHNPSLGAAYRDRKNLAFLLMFRYGRVDKPWDFLAGVGYSEIPSDAILAVYNSDDLQQTNVRCVPVDLQLRLPGPMRLVWDTHFQKKLDPAAPTTSGIVSPENAMRIRTRITLIAAF